MKQEIL